MRFKDAIFWLHAALRDNKVNNVHYLNGLEGCGSKAESGIRQQFFQFMDRMVHVIKSEWFEDCFKYGPYM